MTEIPGFESTAYAYRNGQVVWAGERAVTDHPRNARKPWQPERTTFDATRLHAGAQMALRELENAPVKGLLLWLTGQSLPFPLNHAKPRFDAVRAALERHDLAAFEAAALRVLGLGTGLTPSGDDFVGGIFFAVAHLPGSCFGPTERADLPAAIARIRHAAQTATNPISAALLDDLMAGQSYRALHEMLAALHSGDLREIGAAQGRLLEVGASSGADMLAGLLLALLTLPPKT